MPTRHIKLPVFLASCALLVAAAAAAAASKSSSRDTCQSIECVALSAEIASRMNASADPCADFFNYACGNFPNVVKYSPLRSADVAMVTTDFDFLLEDTIGLMSEKVEKSIYEMLVLDRVATSQDPDMTVLYNFTRSFFRSCRSWLPQYGGGGGGWLDSPRDISADFLRHVYRHLSDAAAATSGGFASLESALAALVRAGGFGLLTVSLPSGFAQSVIRKSDFNLTQTPRAVLHVPMGHVYAVKPDFAALFEFLDKAEVGPPALNFSNRYAAYRTVYEELRQAIPRQWDITNCTGNGTTIRFTIAQLDQLAECVSPDDPFSWSRFFADLLQVRVEPRALVDMPYPHQVMNLVQYFKSRRNFTPSAAARSAPALTPDATFLVFDWLLSFAAFFPREAQNRWLRTKSQAVMPNDVQGDSNSACMSLTKKLLQPIVERMYQKAFHREDFKDIKQLVQLVKSASIASVQRQTWITPSAKASIIRKIQSMQQSIGLDDLTADQLKAFYNATLVKFKQLKLDRERPSKNFGPLLSLAVCANSRKNFDIIAGGSPVSLFMEISPLVVNAFNWVEKNQIIFPMAILAPPVYHPNFPDYINLGSLGYIVGHEIGHSFDDYGHSINQLGVFGHFWDNQTEERYLERMECVRNRYSSYSLYPGGPAHSANTTLGNDIADIMGVSAAVEALRLLKRTSRRPMPRMPNLHKDFSPEQLLFIQVAQTWCIKSEPSVLAKVFGDWPSHSPHHLRIRGIVENSAEFAEAFSCRSGKPMNPRKKCTFW